MVSATDGKNKKLPIWTLQGSTKHWAFKGERKFFSMMRKKPNLDGPDCFQRYWHDKETPPEMFSMSVFTSASPRLVSSRHVTVLSLARYTIVGGAVSVHP